MKSLDHSKHGRVEFVISVEFIERFIVSSHGIIDVVRHGILPNGPVMLRTGSVPVLNLGVGTLVHELP